MFIVVAIVIFGIFVSLSYTLFGKTLQPQVVSLFTQSTEQVAYDLKVSQGYRPVKDTDIVYLQDTDLQTAIKDELSIPKDKDITLSDMKSLTELTATVSLIPDYFEYTDLSIKSLKGLEYAINLEKLTLHGNDVLSLEPLRNLKELTSLNLNYNKNLSSLEPLRGHTNLRTLLIQKSKVKDLEPISNSLSLGVLNLGGTPIKDINDLSKLVNIQTLYIDNTDVSDISILSNFKKLNLIRVSGTKITDFSSIEHIKNTDYKPVK